MKKLISVFMSLVIMSSMFASFAVTTHAAGATVTLTEYVESFQLGISSNKAKAKENATKDGYKLVSDYDLNKGTVGDYIYLAYKTTTDSTLAVRDIIKLDTTDDYDHPSNGATYHVVGGYNDNGKVDAIDINSGASVKDIYLFYTKDISAGNPIADPIISTDEDKNYGRNKYLRDEDNEIANLNYYTTIFTPDIYLFYYQNNYYNDIRLSLDKDDAQFDGYHLIDYDINDGGKATYISYCETGDTDNCITGIYLVDYEEWKNKYQWQHKYYLVGQIWDITDGKIEWVEYPSINRDATEVGDGYSKIYLMYTSTKRTDGDPITSIVISDKILDGYKVAQRLDKGNIRNGNLNEGTYSDNACYILYKTESYNSFTPTYSSIFNDVNTAGIIASFAVIAVGIITGVVFTRKRKQTA